jgi:hypothetical protein
LKSHQQVRPPPEDGSANEQPCLINSGSSGPIAQQYALSDAFQADRAGDYAKSNRIYESVAAQPDASVTFPGVVPREDPGTINALADEYMTGMCIARKQLGDHYAKGLGVPVNGAVATSWLQRAQQIPHCTVPSLPVAQQATRSVPPSSTRANQGQEYTSYFCTPFNPADTSRMRVAIYDTAGTPSVIVTARSALGPCEMSFVDGVTGPISRSCSIPLVDTIVMKQVVRNTPRALLFGGLALKYPILQSKVGQE